MIASKQTRFACFWRAAAPTALLVFAVHTFLAVHSAQAQTVSERGIAVPTPTLFVAPPVTKVAAPAAASVVKPDATKQAIMLPAAPVACNAQAEFARLDRPLLHTMRRLANGQPLTIVAIGSSSTAGAGASSPAATYPSRLAVELRQRFPGRDITVLNRGINGEETHNMMARFATDVIAARPQLVLWQVGTNSVLRDRPLDHHAEELHQGVEELKAIDADVVLIDPQFSPAVIAKPETDGMIEQIALSAKRENVDLFRRFAMMREWHDVEHIGFDTFVSPDQLHMNDWSYACMAKVLGAAIAEAANRPIASAAAHR
jgi:acyl-CoA thioesterase I